MYMHNSLVHALCIGWSVSFLFLLSQIISVPVFADTSQQEAEKKLSKVQNKIQKSQRKIENNRGKIGELEQQLRESEKQIGHFDQQINVKEKQLQSSNMHLHSLENKKILLQEKLNKHQGALYAQVRSEYLFGGQEKLKLLLNQQEPTKIGRTLVYYDYLYRARIHEINEVTGVLQEVKNIKAEIKEQHIKIRNTQISLLQEKNSLQQETKKRNDVLMDLQKNISSEQAKLEKLKEDEKQLKELLERLHSTLTDLPINIEGKDFQESKGDLYWPVIGKPNNKFGQKRNSARNNIIWEGVYIPSNEGNNVRSIFHGRVAFAEWMRGLGLLIIIDHGSGYMSLYGHNQSLYKSVGEWVEAGERIATVGQSGGNLSTGLYFEIRKNGKPINPAVWCTKRASASRPAS